MVNDHHYMQQVLNLAHLTPVQTRPNPQVAALVVKHQQIVGVGVHLQAGDKHAEVIALEQAAHRACGSTLYINLEPCSHFGRTPPCVAKIINSGVSRVVIATLDPNPLVAGTGVAQLKAAGIKVEVGVGKEQAQQINRFFLHNMSYQLPFVTLKAGMSLDGRVATKTQISQWITGATARHDAHQYRVTHDAVVVGVGTVIADNPSLLPHLIPNPQRNPVRIILDRQLRTPLAAQVVSDGKAETWICTENIHLDQHQAYIDHGCRILTFKQLLIANLLPQLYANGIGSLLVEGGEQIYSSFFDSAAVDQLVCYYSPQLIGSTQAKHFYAGVGFANLEHNLKFALQDLVQLEQDFKLVATRVRESDVYRNN